MLYIVTAHFVFGTVIVFLFFVVSPIEGLATLLQSGVVNKHFLFLFFFKADSVIKSLFSTVSDNFTFLDLFTHSFKPGAIPSITSFLLSAFGVFFIISLSFDYLPVDGNVFLCHLSLPPFSMLLLFVGTRGLSSRISLCFWIPMLDL